MPIISINMIQGRTEAQKSQLIRSVAEAVSGAIDAPIDTVRIVITEVPSENWGMGPVTAKSKGR